MPLREGGSCPVPEILNLSKDSREEDELDLACPVCRKTFCSLAGLNKHLLRGHCPVCKVPAAKAPAVAPAAAAGDVDGEKAAAAAKAKLAASWIICQKCVRALPLTTKFVSAKLLNGNPSGLKVGKLLDNFLVTFRHLPHSTVPVPGLHLPWRSSHLEEEYNK